MTNEMSMQASRCAYYSLWSTLLLSLSLLAAPSAMAEMQIVRVCNQGSVDIATATAREQRAFLAMGKVWETQGWQWIAPSDCRNVYVSSLATPTVLNLVFAVRSPGGVFGVIDHPLDVRRIPNREDTICVQPESFSHRSDPLPPCGAGSMEVPTSSALFMNGGVDWKLYVKPAAADFERIAVVLSAPAGSPQAASLPPREKSTWDAYAERMQAIKEEQAAALPKLAQTCTTAGGGEDPRYCQCKAEALIQGTMPDERAAFLLSWSHPQFITLRQQRPGVESKLQTCVAQSDLPAPAPHTPPKPSLPVQPASKAPSIDTIAARGHYLLECFALLRAAAGARPVGEVNAWWKMTDDYLIAASFHAEATGMQHYGNDGRDARVYPHFDRINARIAQGSPPAKAELDACLAFQPWLPGNISIMEAHLNREKGIGLNFGADKQAQLRHDLDFWWQQKAASSAQSKFAPMSEEHLRYGLQQWIQMGRQGTTPQ